ncbi:HAMP domain-containing sensor histidine kinase [Parabacteroides sp. PF5-9]|uniref:sensor histidine kinase n=1 Tax=Parabacteroides sp. PF5-9 TaxID=1742404 RepID=UPI002473F791|nr:HAMP domain-containing sensor histidine kinase [Parabacteroides sp. PF5-9]MDH6358630.1 signal transduction histidine kinase [Parabacteroides sp. PF5-9]
MHRIRKGSKKVCEPIQLNKKNVLFKYLTIWLFSFVMTVFGVEKITAENRLSNDRLLSHLNTLSGNDRLVYLEDLCERNSHEVFYQDYLRIYEKEAIDQQNDLHLGKALEALGRSFYPDEPDSLLYYKERLEIVAERSHQYEPLISLWSTYNFYLAWGGIHENIETSINGFKQFSRKVGSVKGEEAADMNMAYFYLLNNMVEDGEKLYLNVLKSREARNAPIVERVGIFVQLFNHVDNTEKRVVYLKQAEALIDRYKKELKEGEIFDLTMQLHDFSVEWTYAAILLSEDKAAEALEHIKNLEILLVKYNMKEDRKTSLDQLYFDYYEVTGDTQKALEYMDRVEVPLRQRKMFSILIYYLEKRVDIYYNQQRYDEAVQVQKEILQLTDSVTQSDFQNRLAVLRTEYEMEKLEWDKQQTEEEYMESRGHMVILAVCTGVLLLVIIGLVYAIQMINRHKKALKQAKEKAEEADQLKSTFLANMNHEIRTPLNAIVGFSQVLIEEEERELRKEYAEIIQNNNELLQRLISDILDFSKIESNTLSLIYGQYEASDLVKDVYNVMLMRMSEKVKLIMDPCKPIMIDVDRNRLTQILINLLSNAIKHTSSGQINVGYQLKGDRIIFHVQDTGEGMPKDQLDHIFERFIQLKNGQKGVGLGLAISKGLVTAMKGKIWAVSEERVGSTFFVELPQTKPGK